MTQTKRALSEPAPNPARESPGERQAARGAWLVTVGILASRLVGFVRQRFVAHYLGTSPEADAVGAAFRIGNLTQNLLGEGTLSASFIPVYVKLRLTGDDTATRFARAALGMLLPATALITFAGVLVAPALAGVLAPGFDEARGALAIELVRILFPMTGLLVVGAWALGVLTSHRRFLLPYAAPVVWSVAQIVALVIAGSALGLGAPDIARAVAWGTLAGAVLQVFVMVVPVRRLLGSIMPSFDTSAPGLRQAVRNVPGALIGRGVIQISGLVDTALASFLGAGAVATLGYAQTIYLLPMAVLGTGEAAAALPDLAERAGGGEAERAALRQSLGRSVARVLTLGLPAAAVFSALAGEVTTLLFRGGSFGASSTSEVANVLAFYAMGLPANAASRVVSASSFALGDTKSPARFAIVRVVVSTAVALGTMRSLGVSGIVLGAAVAAWLELALLTRLVAAELGGIGWGEVPLARILAAALGTALAGLGARLATNSLGLQPVVAAALILLCAGLTFVLMIQVLGLASLRQLLRPRGPARPAARDGAKTGQTD